MPDRLDGYISLEELRELYTSDDLDSAKLRGIPVQLYFPNVSNLSNESGWTNQDTIQLFQEKVLENDEDLEKFRALWEQAIERDQKLIGEDNNNKLKDNLYEKIFFAYETSEESVDTNDSISIGLIGLVALSSNVLSTH